MTAISSCCCSRRGAPPMLERVRPVGLAMPVAFAPAGVPEAPLRALAMTREREMCGVRAGVVAGLEAGAGCKFSEGEVRAMSVAAAASRDCGCLLFAGETGEGLLPKSSSGRVKMWVGRAGVAPATRLVMGDAKGLCSF